MEGSAKKTGSAAAASGDLLFGGLPLLRGGAASGRGFFLGLPGPRLTTICSAVAGDLAFPVDFFALGDNFFALGVPGFLTEGFDVDAFSELPLETLLASLAFACFAASTHAGQNQLCEEGTDFRGGLRHERWYSPSQPSQRRSSVYEGKYG